jgi:uncharacterized membrane protein
MGSLRTFHPLKGERDFRWRGGDPTRVEALSDMVFAFSLTLLVVSNAPPASFEELDAQLWGFPGFALAFAMLLLLWHAHYIFFRRYALEDLWTTTLNAGFLFLIVFFVYPLKYLATMFSLFLRSLAEGRPEPPMSLENARDALAMASVGYALVFLMLAALYARAMGKAEQLELSPSERALTRFGVWSQFVHVAVGMAAAVAAAVLPVRWAPFAGFIYFLISPLMFALAAWTIPAPKPAPRPGL